MAEEVIKARIEIEADQAIANAARVADAEAGMGNAAAEAGDKAEAASRKLSLKDRAVQSVGSAVDGMVAKWASFTAVGAAVIEIFSKIADNARKAAAAVADVGKIVGEISANIG